MDNTELHYLTYDPDELWQAMNLAYIQAGGDVLYAGDEKEMLLRGMQAILVQAFAGVDNALRMATLRYAQRDYLKLIGETQGVPYIEATAATAVVRIAFEATGEAQTIPAGTAMTADGQLLYTLDDDVEDTGEARTVDAAVTCATAGSAGNALAAGAQLQFVAARGGVLSVTCVTAATGGQPAEDFEHYRERIRTHDPSLSTGSASGYRSAALAGSSEIVDAAAVRTGDGEVTVYLLAPGADDETALVDGVQAALSAQDARPLTDDVAVAMAEAVPYRLEVRYTIGLGASIAEGVAAAVADYQAWQDETIGRAFNPDYLKSLIYQAGAALVQWGSGSHFDGGDVAYTAISPNQHCAGTITVEVVTL